MPTFLGTELQALTHSDSDNHQYFHFLEAGNILDIPEDMRLAVASIDCDYEIQPIAWASIRQWQGIPCVEAFVAPAHRQNRLASSLIAVLLFEAKPPKDQPLGVFSPEIAQIARWLGYEHVREYVAVSDGWIVKDHNEQQRAGVESE